MDHLILLMGYTTLSPWILIGITIPKIVLYTFIAKIVKLERKKKKIMEMTSTRLSCKVTALLNADAIPALVVPLIKV